MAIGDIFSLAPELLPDAFRHMERYYDTRKVQAGAKPSALPTARESLRDVSYSFESPGLTLEDFFARRQTTGMLVLHRNAILLERYALGNDVDSVVICHSVTKSVTATLAGCALADGAIADLDEPILRYLPQLKGSAAGEVSLRHLLTMTSGLRWSLDRSDPDAELSRYDLAVGSRRSGDIMALMVSLPRVASPGTRFCYSSGDSFLLGAAIAAAVGGSLSDYLSERIWKPAGMQTDGHFGIEAPDGLELAGHGLSATLRDFARLGRFVLDDGVINGVKHLPSGWLDEAAYPAEATGTCGYGIARPDAGLGYGYQWWALSGPGQHTRHPDGAFSGCGLFGQWLYLNPRLQLVIAISSAWPRPRDVEANHETFALTAAIEALVR